MHIERFLRESRAYLFAPPAATQTHAAPEVVRATHALSDASRGPHTDRAASRGQVEPGPTPAP